MKVHGKAIPDLPVLWHRLLKKARPRVRAFSQHVEHLVNDERKMKPSDEVLPINCVGCWLSALRVLL
jgi:hypothetical protein